MRPIEYKHTLALLEKIKEDLSKIAYIIRIVVQVVRILYYGLAIYRHYDSIPYLVIYCVLLFVTLLVFAEHLYYHNNEKEEDAKEKHQKRHAALKIIGIVDKTALLIVSLIPILQGKARDFDKVRTLFVFLLLLIQLVFLSVSYLRNKYRKWLKEAIELDYKESLLTKTPSSAFSDKLHDFARNLTGQKRNTELEEDLKDRIEENESKRKEKKKEEKRNRKAQRKKDISMIFSYYSDKRKEKKISDKNIEKALLKLEKEADKTLSDSKRFLNVIHQSQDRLEKATLPEELSCLKDFAFILEKDDGTLLHPVKKARMRNLLYFRKPILSNEDTYQDNRKILEKTKDRIVVPQLESSSDKKKSKRF